MHLPMSVHELQPDLTWDAYRDRITSMAEKAMLDPCTQANPHEPSAEEYSRLYQLIW